jgi:histone H3/H4
MARTKQTITVKKNDVTTKLITSKKTPRATKTTVMPVVVAPSPTAVAIKKTRRVRAGTKALREIRRLQKTTDRQIPASRFYRLLREVVSDVGGQNKRENGKDLLLQKSAVHALHEATEAMLTQLMSEAQLCAIHAGRVEIMKKDLAFAVRNLKLD